MSGAWVRLGGRQRDSLASKYDLSPYDVPHSVRASERDGLIRLEFRYMDGDEPLGSPEDVGDHIRVIYGRYTRRIAVVEIDLALLETNPCASFDIWRGLKDHRSKNRWTTPNREYLLKADRAARLATQDQMPGLLSQFAT